LSKNDIELPDKITVKWGPLKMDVTVDPPTTTCSFIPKSWRWG